MLQGNKRWKILKGGALFRLHIEENHNQTPINSWASNGDGQSGRSRGIGCSSPTYKEEEIYELWSLYNYLSDTDTTEKTTRVIILRLVFRHWKYVMTFLIASDQISTFLLTYPFFGTSSVTDHVQEHRFLQSAPQRKYASSPRSSV